MIATDEDALICDLAETYHIYDYRSLSPVQIATFSVGLRDDSRIKMKLRGINFPTNTMLLAAIVDRLSILVWHKTKDGQKGRNKPKSILEAMVQTEEKEKDYEVFDTPEAFEAAMARINKKGG